MPSAENTSRLLTVLRRELKLLEEYNKGCEALHKDLVGKNWNGLETTLNLLRGSAAELEERDREREDLIRDLKKDAGLQEEASFRMLLTRLEPEVGSEVGILKSRIRHAVNILQVRLKGIGRYSDNQTGILGDMLSEIMPEKKGKIYTSSGVKSPGENRPLLINHRL